MGLETGTYINDLVTTNPVGATDAKSEGDNHLRLIKTVLKNSFPGMTSTLPEYLKAPAAIGGTAPAAGSFTTLSATGILSVSKDSLAEVLKPTTLAAACYVAFQNSAESEIGYLGYGTATSAGATLTLMNELNGPVVIAANSATVASFSSTGLAVTGVITATGHLQAGSGGGSPGQLAYGSNTLQMFMGTSGFQLVNSGNTASRIIVTDAGAVSFPAINSSAYAAGDKYLVVDASGNIHVSAIGPGS